MREFTTSPVTTCRTLRYVWDLYGAPDAPVLVKRSHAFGHDGSVCVYQRINLRATTRDAIDARTAWTRAERDDHLAVLWFVAAAEGVPAGLLREYLSKERLMESELYRELFGEAEARARAKDILTVLAARGIGLGDTIRERILTCTDLPTLDVWIQRAAVAPTAASVVRAKAKGAVPPARRRTARSRKT